MAHSKASSKPFVTWSGTPGFSPKNTVLMRPGRSPQGGRFSASPASEAWRHFLAEIDDARKELGYKEDWSGDRECYYRGHSHSDGKNTEWTLLPSLFRCSMPEGISNRERKAHHKKREYDLFFEFQARARELHTLSMSSWDVLFAMQHFKVPTRLLDWTEVFGVALHFALDGWKPGGRPPCIWILNPYELNLRARGLRDLFSPKHLRSDSKTKKPLCYEELVLKQKRLGWNLPIAVYPELKNNRLHAQHGSFTIHGDCGEPLDVQFQGKQKGVLRRVELPLEAVPEARKFLLQAGIDHQLLFPDLDGLATSLKFKYLL